MIPSAPSRPETLRALVGEFTQLLEYVTQMADLLGSTSQIAEEARIRMPAWRALAHSALAGPQAPSGWQPIETAPKDGTEILLTDGSYKRTGYWARRAGVWSVDTAVALKPPTLWLPLPSLPLPASPSVSTEQP